MQIVLQLNMQSYKRITITTPILMIRPINGCIMQLFGLFTISMALIDQQGLSYTKRHRTIASGCLWTDSSIYYLFFNKIEIVGFRHCILPKINRTCDRNSQQASFVELLDVRARKQHVRGFFMINRQTPPGRPPINRPGTAQVPAPPGCSD